MEEVHITLHFNITLREPTLLSQTLTADSDHWHSWLTLHNLEVDWATQKSQ